MWPKSSPPHPAPRLARGDGQGTGVPPAFPETKFAWSPTHFGRRIARRAAPAGVTELNYEELGVRVHEGTPRQTSPPHFCKRRKDPGSEARGMGQPNWRRRWTLEREARGMGQHPVVTPALLIRRANGPVACQFLSNDSSHQPATS